MTKRVLTNVVFIVCLCTPFLTTAQDKDAAFRVHHEKAIRISEKIELTIKAKEPKWKLKDVMYDGASYQRDGVWQVEVSAYQRWRSRPGELTLTIFVYESDEEASKMQKQRSGWSSVAGSEKLEAFGDEAYYITHRYFSWVSVRRGRVSIEVHGPAGLTVTRRFAQHALEQIEDQ
jgi:hypothetical protein